MNEELVREIDNSYNELREAVRLLLEGYVPLVVTCPHCEREFDLTEIDWDRMIDDVIIFMLEGGKV